MDEGVKDAIQHERELREKDIDQLKKCISSIRDYHEKSLNEIDERMKSIAVWDKFKSIGYILIGAFLSTFPQLVPMVKQLLK